MKFIQAKEISGLAMLVTRISNSKMKNILVMTVQNTISRFQDAISRGSALLPHPLHRKVRKVATTEPHPAVGGWYLFGPPITPYNHFPLAVRVTFGAWRNLLFLLKESEYSTKYTF